MKEPRLRGAFCSVLAVCLLTSCTFVKIIWHNFSDIDDYRIFPCRELRPSKTPYRFIAHSGLSRIPNRIRDGKHDMVLFEDLLKSNGTVAFLVIRNDTVLFERYYDEYRDSSLSLSFSMAKSFLSILAGCAIDDGFISSVEQPVTDFVPELMKNGFGKVKVKHLLQMTSGMDYVESGNPFGIHPHFYYTADLEAGITELKLKEEPGKRFVYKSGDYALLGLVLSRALKSRTITGYMQERIWEPLGMEYGGLWSIDHEGSGLEKTFCCVAARTRDFAKLARLYLNHGNWNGKQIVSRSWVELSTRIDTTEGSVWNYQYGWWIVTREHGDFLAQGHLGQFLYVNPQKRFTIVRLGRSTGNLDSEDWKKVFIFLSEEVHEKRP